MDGINGIPIPQEYQLVNHCTHQTEVIVRSTAQVLAGGIQSACFGPGL